MNSSATALKRHIEAKLARRVPTALSPPERVEQARQRLADVRLTDLLQGGIPVGAITEIYGAACSGRTSCGLSLAAAVTTAGNVAAWVDASDSFDPECAALGGVDIERLLWVRCGTADPGQRKQPHRPAEAVKRGREEACFARTNESPNLVMAAHRPKPVGPAGCGSSHPRGEGRGMSEAIDTLLQGQPRSPALKQRREHKSIGTPGAQNRDVTALPFPNASPYREEQVPTDRQSSRRTLQRSADLAGPASKPRFVLQGLESPVVSSGDNGSIESWQSLDQALRAVDLLLNAGGFGLIVLDLGNIPSAMAWRIPLATWFRYRAGCQRSRSILLVISQHPCVRTSADLTASVTLDGMQTEGATVATGSAIRLRVEQQRRGAEASAKFVPLSKPVCAEDGGVWMAASPWSLQA